MGTRSILKPSNLFSGNLSSDGEVIKKVRTKKGEHTHVPAVQRRNARERNRVRQVNQGFAILRQRIPFETTVTKCGRERRERKLSKVDTLRCAVEYIQNLERLLETDEGGEDETKSNEIPCQTNDARILTQPFDLQQQMFLSQLYAELSGRRNTYLTGEEIDRLMRNSDLNSPLTRVFQPIMSDNGGATIECETGNQNVKKEETTDSDSSIYTCDENNSPPTASSDWYQHDQF
ncbi:uncharacterized protein LOC136032388 [Artemia franciscana]|uniref:BHLH domain-containing protein n=1 Tax=Artemia franciscana TaxID=6661 RepID=A0AA88IGQ1_ARTSF|nr:hypothetical protein QYM36_000802 [Artemia franciscana]